MNGFGEDGERERDGRGAKTGRRVGTGEQGGTGVSWTVLKCCVEAQVVLTEIKEIDIHLYQRCVEKTVSVPDCIQLIGISPESKT